MGGPTWPSECVETMRVLIMADMSFSSIAAELYTRHNFSVSRNAVSTAIHRRRGEPGWPPRTELAGERVFRPIPKSTKTKTFATITTEEGRAYDAASLHVTLAGNDGCRWPVNDPAPGETFLFCGLDAEPGKSYCAHHLARGYRPAGSKLEDDQ